MNHDPHAQEDAAWQSLLARANPTFTGNASPPYGFVTRAMARLKSERGEREILERIGLRAFFSSLAVLVAVVGFTVGLQIQDRFDLEPGLNSVFQVDDVPLA
jgi:hypothetical protein